MLAAAVRADAPMADGLKKIMKQARYSEPWLAEQEARELAAVRQLYDGKLGTAVVAHPAGLDTGPIAELLEEDR